MLDQNFNNKKRKLEEREEDNSQQPVTKKIRLSDLNMNDTFFQEYSNDEMMEEGDRSTQPFDEFNESFSNTNYTDLTEEIIDDSVNQLLLAGVPLEEIEANRQAYYLKNDATTNVKLTNHGLTNEVEQMSLDEEPMNNIRLSDRYVNISSEYNKRIDKIRSNNVSYTYSGEMTGEEVFIKEDCGLEFNSEEFLGQQNLSLYREIQDAVRGNNTPKANNHGNLNNNFRNNLKNVNDHPYRMNIEKEDKNEIKDLRHSRDS
ncbi:MAG: hypothetical protein J0H68_02170 [Sphingobacteriia bacterium]|nr:hypothetical protein [Sphingobacteriia bacterium]